MATKKEIKPIKKTLFDIKMEIMVPSILTYRIEAETAEEALKLIETKRYTQFQPNLNKRIKLNAKVYNAGTVILRHTKTYRNR